MPKAAGPDNLPMTFTKPWSLLQPLEEGGIPVPILDAYLEKSTGELIRDKFLVDSGADVSMGPRRLCDLLGLSWDEGVKVEIVGISPRKECAVTATIHQVAIYIPEAARRITLPFCFAEGDAPARRTF